MILAHYEPLTGALLACKKWLFQVDDIIGCVCFLAIKITQTSIIVVVSRINTVKSKTYQTDKTI